MSKKSISGGVTAKGQRRIQFDFMFEGARYRPTLLRTPSEANLRRARQQLEGMKQRIAVGTFVFEDEFPDFRDLQKMPGAGSSRTCAQVFDDFLAHCEARVVKSDLAAVTLASYRKILNGIWRPQIGTIRLFDVRYSMLVGIVDANAWSKKTHNNTISALRCAFRFGYRDHPERHNPAWALKCARIRKRDRPVIDPFRMRDAEALIAAIHRDWGEAQGNYDELRFFTGLRPSEEIALTVADFDAAQRTLTVNKARVAGIDKDSTKTGAPDRTLPTF